MKDQVESLVLQMYQGGLRYSEAVREFQEGFILTALREQKVNQCRAAQKLGMHRNSLRRIICDLQLDIQSIRAAVRRRPLRSEPPVSLEKREHAR